MSNNEQWLEDVANAAWSVLYPESGSDGGGDLAIPETPAPASEATDAPQYFETDVEGVVADSNDNFYSVDEQNELTPYEYETAPAMDREELEAAAFFSQLDKQGVDLETATEDQLGQAVEYASAFEDRFSDQMLDKDMRAAMDRHLDDEEDLAHAAQGWLDDLGATYEDVAPYIEQAEAAVEAGHLDGDVALDIAAEAYRRATAAQDDADRERRYRGLGFNKGMDAALSDVWSRAEGGEPKLYKPTPSKTARGWQKALDTQLDKTLAGISAKQATREVARKRASRGR